MTTMRYKGYTATVEIEPEAKVIAGRVFYLRDVLYFEAETPAEAMTAFHETVDDYLAWAAEDGFEPDRPYSGKLPFRTTPEHHRKIALAAAQTGKSINAWMDDVVTQAADTVLGDHSRDSHRAAGA
ncbi:MAG: type II toxin-antitoxin system HicB family antitoxin [Thermomicrobia bacterium]|nr:type II toxin-antitoxin system HicB family antitoxin [Thermomicrobia bacterium]MCA1723684.1 type II toxin-antitoxin system HicB family antitoxin [Thermomicrobia bacterium]